jgi:hypothetical protein
VPASVPSDFHNSYPLDPSLAEKKIVPEAVTVIKPANDEASPGAMSRTSAVPPGVPSVRHSS